MTKRLHAWDVTPDQARRIQDELRGKLTDRSFPQKPSLVAGVDAGYPKDDKTIVIGAVVVVSLPGFNVVDSAFATTRRQFPYRSGLLTFREGPAVLAAFEGLKCRPDVAIFDGQGQAHPRKMGIAAHLGLWLNLPTVGCAKTRLVGEHDQPGPNKGDHAPLVFRGETIGAVVRTRVGVKPVYVSPGHLMDVDSAVSLVLECTTKYRLPEPIRLAHRLARTTAGG